MEYFFLIVTFISLISWLVLIFFWGQFWRADQRLDSSHSLEHFPSVFAVIPARNEADLLPITLKSLLNQDYPGLFQIILVDDQSTDGTAKVAEDLAKNLAKSHPLEIVNSQTLPQNWTGKLWAVEQGIRHAQQFSNLPDYFLLTDADIEHHATNVRELVAKAEAEKLDLVSLMVLLRCKSFWEKLLIPAFVFFFQKLYPFPWVNDPKNATAAAAGGCVLIKRKALDRIGGIQILRTALIDDCTLAKAVKQVDKPNDAYHPIWLGLTELTKSLRPYPSLSSVWNLVARTAFTQLNYSLLLLLGTLIGMTLIYLVPPLSLFWGLLMKNYWVFSLGLLACLLMSLAYYPTIRLYNLSPIWVIYLPAIAFLYTLMTLDSAWRHFQGKGGRWKGRTYSQEL